MSSDACLHCHMQVRPHQEALLCDKCDRWQHKNCNTGIITRVQYRQLEKGEIDMPFWYCKECKMPDVNISFYIYAKID